MELARFLGDGAALPPKAAMHVEVVAIPKIFLAAAFGGRRHIKTHYFELPPECGFLGGNLREAIRKKIADIVYILRDPPPPPQI